MSKVKPILYIAEVEKFYGLWIGIICNKIMQFISKNSVFSKYRSVQGTAFADATVFLRRLSSMSQIHVIK